MDSKTKFIVLMVILVLLYIASLGMGVMLNSSGDVTLDGLQRRAEGVVGSALEAFADRLDLRRLKCSGESVASGFALDVTSRDTDECVLRLDPGLDDDDEFVKTEIRLAPAPVASSGQTAKPPAVFLFANFAGEEFPQRSPHTDDCKFSEADLDPYNLVIRYEPNDASDTEWSCWLRRELPLSLTVTRAGGTLSMSLGCRDCGNRSQRKVALRMK